MQMIYNTSLCTHSHHCLLVLPGMPGEHVVHAVGVVHAADAERRNPKQYVTRSSHHHLQQLFGL